MTVGRSTQSVTEALVSADPKGRSTQSVTEALISADPKGRATQVVIEVLATFSNDLSVPITCQALVLANLTKTDFDELSASITVSATLGVNLSKPGYLVDITASGIVTANLTGIRQFSADITATGELTSDILSFVQLTTDIIVSTDVVVDLRENIEYLIAPISANVLVTTKLDVPWHGGNTLVLVDTINLDTILEFSLTDTLVLTHSVGLVFGQRALLADNTLVLSQLVTVKHVLPTKTASNTLALTQSAVAHRQAESFLILTQLASGTVAFIEGIATNSLSLTQQLNLDTILLLPSSSLLTLTQTVNSDADLLVSASNTLNLTQLTLGLNIGSKPFVVLQAPFEFIQTTIVLPNPLLDDTKNLVSNLTLRRAMNGKAFTYVKSNKNRLLKYTFTLDRLKGLELENFIDVYNGEDIKIQNWKGEIWKVKIVNNPIDFVQTRRYAPGGDRTDVNLEFEGVQINE